VVYHQPAIAIPVMQVCTKTKVFAKPLSPRGSVHIIAAQLDIDADLSSLSVDLPLVKSLRLILDHFHIDHLPACEIRISSTIPIGSGLGSSASSSVSLIRAVAEFLGHYLDDQETSQLAYEMEKIHHGNPSGIDNSVITYAKPVYFTRGEQIEFLEIPKPFELIIANTGTRASTADAVAGVKERHDAEPQKYDAMFAEIGDLVKQVKTALMTGEIAEVGPLLTQDHHLLKQLGVSCPQLDKLVAAALKSGALGAKLSGGGLGGNMLALVDGSLADDIEKHLLSAGAVSTIRSKVFPTSEAA
jgi:mevalonate kinase